MKATQILQALHLPKRKETIAYCGKLATIFEFLKQERETILESAIVETGITINEVGKVVLIESTRELHLDALIGKYMATDRAVQSLCNDEYNLHRESHKISELLWKKRKNKDNSKIEAQKDEIIAELDGIESKKTALREAELARLQGVTFPVAEIRKELNLFEGCKILVETAKGVYSFYLPIGNDFYFAVCLLLNLEFEAKAAAKKDIVHRFITFDVVLDNIRKAAKFVATDELRPAMQCVCLDLSNEGLQIVATDAHRLYYSKHISIEGYSEPIQFLIAPESVKTLSKLKSKDEPLNIVIYSDNTASLNGFEVTLLDARFPDYKVVVPKYDGYMEFDKATLIKNIKKVLPYANKSTSQVNFHLNGSIAINACDVDFSFECDAEMPYISKGFPDSDISFNGIFLTEILGVFKEKTVKMLSEGKATKAAVFTNDTDSMLLMPLMNNGY